MSRSPNSLRLPAFILLLGASLAACGPSTDEHNAVLSELTAAQLALDQCQSDGVTMAGQIAAYELSDSECQGQLAGLRAHIDASSHEQDRRDAIYDQLVGRLQGMIDNGQLQVRVEDGRIVLVLPNDVLFESGDAQLGDAGTATLTSVAAALSDITDQQFQVEGHTDNVPMSSGRFESNWDLSTARAVSVVNLLVEQGVAPANLSAAGFGEFSPATANATDADRALNRRIVIVLVPDLGDLPEVRADAS